MKGAFFITQDTVHVWK